MAQRLNAGGLAMVVAAADENREPSCCRAVAVTATDDGTSVTVYVPVATSQKVIADLALNPYVAIVVSEPITHQSLQIKGPPGTVRLATAAERDLITNQMERFCAVLEEIGMSRRVSSRINRWPAFAIEMRVEEVFDQTPGPKAGQVVQ